MSLLERLLSIGPVRKTIWRLWYPFLTRRLRSQEVLFLNYAFETDPPLALPLDQNDEPDRACIQLYHHVAGHTNKGTHILDTHSDHVVDPVWELYQLCHERTGGRSTMVEWDENIPAFEVVFDEVMKAAVYRRNVEGDDFSLPERHPPNLRREAPDGATPHPAGLEAPDAGDLFVREKNLEFAVSNDDV